MPLHRRRGIDIDHNAAVSRLEKAEPEAGHNTDRGLHPLLRHTPGNFRQVDDHAVRVRQDENLVGQVPVEFEHQSG